MRKLTNHGFFFFPWPFLFSLVTFIYVTMAMVFNLFSANSLVAFGTLTFALLPLSLFAATKFNDPFTILGFPIFPSKVRLNTIYLWSDRPWPIVGLSVLGFSGAIFIFYWIMETTSVSNIEAGGPIFSLYLGSALLIPNSLFVSAFFPRSEVKDISSISQLGETLTSGASLMSLSFFLVYLSPFYYFTISLFSS